MSTGFRPTLDDGTLIFDLLNDQRPYKDRYCNENIIGLRVHGLIGDCIKATTILSSLIKEDPSRSYVFLISYNDNSKKEIIKDLFADLIAIKKVAGLFFNQYHIVGNISFPQFSFLRELGCKQVLDLYYHSSDSYKGKTDIAYLGFSQPQPSINKVALFRFTGFHQHVPLRHISESGWNELEAYLLNLGLEVCLYGYDDTMKVTSGVKDFRKKLNILETIKHSSDAGLCISTTTFLPLYLHHFIPCLVYVDPVDLPHVSLKWRSTHNYIPINTQMKDYIDFVKNYVSMWYLSNMNTGKVLQGIALGLTSRK